MAGPSFASAAGSDSIMYKVLIWANGENSLFAGDCITAWMPEQFQMSISANYSEPLGGSIAGNPISGQNAGVVGKMLGGALNLQNFTLKTWDSTSGLVLNLPLIFMAVNDTQADVKIPVAQLMSACMPYVDDGQEDTMYMTAPGPSYNDPEKNTYRIQYGNILDIPNCIITSASLVAESLIFRGDGQLIGCQIDITVEPTKMMTGNDFAEWFSTSDGGDLLTGAIGAAIDAVSNAFD